MKKSAILLQLAVIIVSNLFITISFISKGFKPQTNYKSNSYFSLYEATTSLIERSRRPKQIGIPRKRMELPFAVLLMRSSYAIVDELDFTPMDEFQKAFFLFRQNEWQEYKNQHPNVMQGDLADPVYFDFISLCQYAVIADSMRNGKTEFVEKVGAEGNTTVVHRDSKYMSNNLLPPIHSDKVGDAILDFLYEKYPASILPNLNHNNNNKMSSSNDDLINQFLIDAQLILDIFSFNSFALNMKIDIRPENSKNSNKSSNNNNKRGSDTNNNSGNNLPSSSISSSSVLAEISMQAPVNLWSQQVLTLRQDQPVNHFDIKALQALTRRSGKYNNNNSNNSGNNNRVCLDYISTSVRNDIDVTHLVHISTYTV